MYTEVELKAMTAADEAFAEVRKVAERFAKEINCDYRRTVNSWSSYSAFDVPLFDSRHMSWEPVEHFANDFDGWGAYECAIALVEKWNESIVRLAKKRDTLFDKKFLTRSSSKEDWYENQINLVYDARAYLLEELGKIVEDWYDTASEDAYEAYIEEKAYLEESV